MCALIKSYYEPKANDFYIRKELTYHLAIIISLFKDNNLDSFYDIRTPLSIHKVICNQIQTSPLRLNFEALILKLSLILIINVCILGHTTIFVESKKKFIIIILLKEKYEENLHSRTCRLTRAVSSCEGSHVYVPESES